MEKAKGANPFSQLTYLLRLVTTLNFDENLRSSFKRKGNASAPGSEFTLLDSVAAVLVQDHEVIATCYTSDSDTISVVAEKDDFPQTDVDVDVDMPPDAYWSIQVAALSNSEYTDELADNQNPHKVQIQPEGVSLWEKVRDTETRGWYCGFMGPRRLRDHVATLSAYLDDYKNAIDSANQGEYSFQFTNYLISTCWPKMVRRIQSWQAMGFMYLAKSISTEQLHIFGTDWDGFPTNAGPGDRTLKTFLCSLKDGLKRKLLLASDRDKNYRALKYTEADFPLMFSGDTASIFFSKDSIVEFHKITMAAFDGFAYSFMRLKNESGKLTDAERTPLVSDDIFMTTQQTLVFDLLKSASNHYRFLLAIICSNSFTCYFQMIKENQKQNVLPVHKQRHLYDDYKRKMFSNIAKDVKRLGDVKQIEDAEVEANDLEGEVEGDEFDDIGSSKEDNEEDLSRLLRFLKTFVVHLTAKRALERYSFKTRGHEAKISLFAVERSPLLIPTGSWSKMKAILTESLSLDPSESSTSAGDADIAIKAIKLLEDKIEMPPQKCSLKCQKLLTDFKKIIDDVPVLLPGRMHCETVLASLSKYYRNFLVVTGDNNASLTSTCEKLLHSNIMSVSKLCCPVCWALLAVLADKKPLSLRGSHCSFYPVELPVWLPPEIVDNMHKLFQNHLREEITIMLNAPEQPATQQNRHASHESESNFSEASSTNSTYNLEDNK